MIGFKTTFEILELLHQLQARFILEHDLGRTTGEIISVWLILNGLCWHVSPRGAVVFHHMLQTLNILQCAILNPFSAGLLVSLKGISLGLLYIL